MLGFAAIQAVCQGATGPGAADEQQPLHVGGYNGRSAISAPSGMLLQQLVQTSRQRMCQQQKQTSMTEQAWLLSCVGMAL
jgi:hypothetical protein